MNTYIVKKVMKLLNSQCISKILQGNTYVVNYISLYSSASENIIFEHCPCSISICDINIYKTTRNAWFAYTIQDKESLIIFWLNKATMN